MVFGLPATVLHPGPNTGNIANRDQG